MSYKVNFVTDEEFEKLPGKDMQDKVGVAYPEYGEAYVRKSGSSALDVFTAMHELEHLEGKDLDEHYDSENKCYYKHGLMQSLIPALGAASFLIPGVGPAIGGAFGSLGGGLGSILGPLGSALHPIGSALSGAGSAFAGAGKAAQTALGITGAGAGAGASGASGGSALSSFGVPTVASAGEGAASVGGALGPGALATPAAGISGGGAGAGVGSGVGGALSKGAGIAKGGMKVAGAANMGMQGAHALGFGQQNQMPDMQSLMNQFSTPETPQQQSQPNVIQAQGAGQATPGSNFTRNRNGFYSGRL